MNAPGDRERQLSYDPRTGTYRATVDWGRTDPVSGRVVAVVADVLGVEPSALEPLADSVEPDALDDLFRPRESGGRRADGLVRFRFNGRDVIVDGRGEVVVGRPGIDLFWGDESTDDQFGPSRFD